jgi:hypothetical protein
MARNFRSRILLLLLAVLITSTCVLAGSQTEGWSPEELALAKHLGLNLKPSGGFRYRSVGEQTWLAPWVVEGTVQRIDEDLYGPYHTKVKVHVDRYLKGSGPSEITLNTIDGRLYSEYDKRIIRVHSVNGVTFSSQNIQGRFVLFLNKRAISAPGREEDFKLYQHAEDEFNPANRYRINHGRAEPDAQVGQPGSDPGAESHSYNAIVTEILRVAEPQARLAEGRQ